MSHRITRVTAALVAIALTTALPANAATARSADDGASVRTVAVIDPGPGGAFAESMAWAGRGTLVTSVNHWGVETEPGVWSSNIADIVSVPARGGTPTTIQSIDLGTAAMVLGIAVDEGDIYLVVNNYSGDPAGQPASGVLRITKSGVERAMTLPLGSSPNGLAIVDHTLYVTDSGLGAVWVGPSRGSSAPTEPWFTSPLLLPSADPNLPPIGANGIVYSRGSMLVASWAQGLILKVPVLKGGTAGVATLLAQDPLLVEVDGLALERNGDLLATVNKDAGSLLRVSKRGDVVPVALPDGALDYPTQAVVTEDDTFVVNGSFFNGTPSVIEVSTRISH